ncbi:Dihydrolipoyl dehydrogenase [Thelotrema lepadinum]|nr:Dihydrolipoyl dehydrogenase [Thelotrema lepadinum]
MASNTTPPRKAMLFTVSSIETQVYDAIFIGSGWASRPAAERVVKAGLTALIIDNELMGGDCPFWACVPSKALLRPSEALEAANAVGGARERLTNQKVDAQAVFARRNAITREWDDTKLLVPVMLATGTDLLRGKAKLVGVKKVSVASDEGQTIEITARHAVAICTGSVPVIPDISGLKEAKPWTPREATSSSVVPKTLVVIGAGAVGCEMATAYSSLGSNVTVITHSKEILTTADSEAGEAVRKGLEARGVQFLLDTSVTRVERAADGNALVKTSSGASISASEILVATGRRARTNDCGLEVFYLPVNGRPVEVDESLRVKGIPGDWLYSIGDVNGRSPLTHMCKYQGRVAGTAIVRSAQGHSVPANAPWAATSATADHHAIPQVVFTQPALASVGLTQAMAEKHNRRVRVIKTPAVTVGALLHGDNFGEGWAQWVVDGESEKLLGMTVVGQDVTELIYPATVAIAGGLRLEQLAHAVPCFPTMSEVYLNLLEAAGL